MFRIVYYYILDEANYIAAWDKKPNELMPIKWLSYVDIFYEDRWVDVIQQIDGHDYESLEKLVRQRCHQYIAKNDMESDGLFTSYITVPADSKIKECRESVYA